MKAYIEKCLTGGNLTSEEAAAALDLIMTGQATDIQIAGLIVALRAKGETVDEIVGFVKTMRAHAITIAVDDPDAIDMCGTGGDGRGTFNISTVASLVAAGAGVTVAKHGNRSVSSRSGSADLLMALGVNIQVPPARVQECVNSIGVGFLFAPLFHPAMKYAGKPRSELGVRTIFNILGPMTNPALVRRQLLGTFNKEIAPKLAAVLQRLDARKVLVVHSADGMDEISIAAATTGFEAEPGKSVAERTIQPRDFGLQNGTATDMLGGSAEENARIAKDVLDGHKTRARDVVIANAAAGIYVAGKASSLAEGATKATESIDSGKARQSLSRLIDLTNRP